MNILIWLLVGGLVGWQASMFASPDGRQGLLLNIGIGIVGAVIGGWLFIGPFDTWTMTDVSVGGFLVALLGAPSLLALLKLVQSTTAR